MAGTTDSGARATLGSRLGFLMLAAGCAVGLGNVWRFPFIVGRNGGAAFVILYLLFLALLGFPLLTAELALGRGAKQGIAGALAALAPSRLAAKGWGALGTLIFAGDFVLMIYYTDVAGWLLKYTGDYVAGSVPAGDPGAAFGALVANPWLSGTFMALVVALATGVCLAGVAKGVERVTKVLMLSLLTLLVILAVKALALPGAEAGLSFYLKPDWAKLFAHPAQAVFDAMGQAFFTLSVGIGCMTIFGSYVGRAHSLVKESIWIIAIDTFVALLAGLIIFPACAAYGVAYTEGPGLIFVALPKVFHAMPGGRFWGALFFLFLFFAALTTVIAVFECLIGGLLDSTRSRGTRDPTGCDAVGPQCTRSRTTVALLVGAGVALCALPCVMWEPVLGWEDFAVSQLWLPLGGLAIGIFVTRRCGWGWEKFRAEASAGVGAGMPAWLGPWMKWGIPVLILAILVGGLVQKFGK